MRFIPTIFLSVVVIALCVYDASAQVMQSSNYRILNDSINVGGGFGSSSNYALESTVGEIGTGEGSSASYQLSAGYQMADSYLALSVIDNVNLSPDIGGVTGGESNGSTIATTTTDNSGGYQMTITASSTPAMQSTSATIADYVPAGSEPDYDFTFSASQAYFGFSPEGTDIAARYKNSGTTCGSGSSDDTLSCWDGLSTTPTVIARRTSSNHPNGIPTTVRFRVGVGGSVSQLPGTYIATTTITVTAL